MEHTQITKFDGLDEKLVTKIQLEKVLKVLVRHFQKSRTIARILSISGDLVGVSLCTY